MEVREGADVGTEPLEGPALALAPESAKPTPLARNPTTTDAPTELRCLLRNQLDKQVAP